LSEILDGVEVLPLISWECLIEPVVQVTGNYSEVSKGVNFQSGDLLLLFFLQLELLEKI